LRLNFEDIEQRESRWAIPDLVGKGNRFRTVPVPGPVEGRVDEWTRAAGISSGRLFRPIGKGGRVKSEKIGDEKAVWHLVPKYACAARAGEALAPRLEARVREIMPQGGRRPRTNPATARPRLDPDHGTLPRNGTGSRLRRQRRPGPRTRLSGEAPAGAYIGKLEMLSISHNFANISIYGPYP